MTSAAAGLRVRIDENETDKINKVKKFGLTAVEQTKRAALGDLQNRGVLRTAVNGKDVNNVVQKDVNEIKLQNVLRNAKARVDSHWKKAPLGATTNNGALAAQNKVLTRSNSLRLPSTTTTNATSGINLQRHGSNNLLAHNKPKTLITKLVENKVQQVKLITKTSKVQVEEKTKIANTKPGNIDTKLRREDSNLSRKSLTKLKAALTSRDVNVIKPVAKTNSASAVLQAKKEKEQQQVQEKEQQQLKTNNFISTQTIKYDLKIVSVQSHSSELIKAVENIDADDSENLMLVSEYANDIYNYLYTVETEQPVDSDHLADQIEVSPKMRAVLIDWINEVHLQFRLVVETFHMAVAIIDRYLQLVKDTKRSHLQLVGVTALFIAAKYEELFPPAISDFVYITDESYTVNQILQMELKILKALDCNLSRPLSIQFLRRYSKAAKAEDCHHTMSKYLIELVSVEYDLASYKPSEIAAASLFLSLHLLNGNAKTANGINKALWTPTLEWYSRYSVAHLRPITRKIANVARKAANEKLKAIYTKYQSTKFQKISLRTELYSALMDSIIADKE